MSPVKCHLMCWYWLATRINQYRRPLMMLMLRHHWLAVWVQHHWWLFIGFIHWWVNQLLLYKHLLVVYIQLAASTNHMLVWFHGRRQGWRQRLPRGIKKHGLLRLWKAQTTQLLSSISKVQNTISGTMLAIFVSIVREKYKVKKQIWVAFSTKFYSL